MKPAQKAWSELGWQVAGALFAAGMIAAIGFLAVRGESTRRLNPCGADPAGQKCAEQRQAVARAEPIRNPCTSYQRVTGSRGRNCRRFFVDRGYLHGLPNFGSRGGGDASQPSTGKQQPGSRGGGSDEGSKGGTQDGPKSSPKSPKPSSEADHGEGPRDTPADTEPPKSLPEEATGKVEEVVSGVTGAAEGAACGTIAAPGCSR